MKKILIITGTRAEWGLLEPLANKLQDEFITHLGVTGTHLSPHHGMTINDINFEPKHRIEIIMANDSAVAVSKSMAMAVSGFGELYERIKPDLIVCLGDRFEIAGACCSAVLFNIPIAHIHGGESSRGSYDDIFRNVCTMAATLHFPATYKYRANIAHVINDWSNVHMVGALGCDGLEKRKENRGKHIIISIHPETRGSIKLKDFFNGIPKDKDKIIIKSNYDVGQNTYSGNVYDRKSFLDLLRDADCIIGNSSSGIIEAPALGVPTINIGIRQQGRLMADSIIQADATVESIQVAFGRLYSDEFQAMMQTDYYVPYRGENVAEKIVEKIKEWFEIKNRGIYNGIFDCYD